MHNNNNNFHRFDHSTHRTSTSFLPLLVSDQQIWDPSGLAPAIAHRRLIYADTPPFMRSVGSVAAPDSSDVFCSRHGRICRVLLLFRTCFKVFSHRECRATHLALVVIVVAVIGPRSFHFRFDQNVSCVMCGPMRIVHPFRSCSRTPRVSVPRQKVSTAG